MRRPREEDWLGALMIGTLCLVVLVQLTTVYGRTPIERQWVACERRCGQHNLVPAIINGVCECLPVTSQDAP